MRSHSQAHRFGGPGSSEFDTSSPSLLLLSLLQLLLLLVLVLSCPAIRSSSSSSTLSTQAGRCTDTPHIIIVLLPLPIPHISQLLPQQPNFALNCIVPIDNASSVWTFSTWVTSEDWMSWSWVWGSLSAGVVDDADVVDDGCWGCSGRFAFWCGGRTGGRLLVLFGNPSQ
jgi:hypothetical protein